MFVYSLATQNNIPNKCASLDDMKARREDFAKSFAFPAELKRAHGYKLLAVEACADGFVVGNYIAQQVEGMDGLQCDEVMDFTTSVESHLEFDMVLNHRAEDFDSL